MHFLFDNFQTKGVVELFTAQHGNGNAILMYLDLLETSLCTSNIMLSFVAFLSDSLQLRSNIQLFRIDTKKGKASSCYYC